MPESALQTVFQATVMAKVLCTTSAWWGFTSASDRQRIAAFVGCAKRSGLCQADQPPVTQLVKDADDKLFQSVLYNPEHTLHQLLPDRRHNITHSLIGHQQVTQLHAYHQYAKHYPIPFPAGYTGGYPATSTSGPRVGPGHPSYPLSIYFLILSPFYFSLSFIGFTYFLLLSIPSLSTRIVPLRFQVRGRRRRPNLGLVFVV